MSNRIGVEQTDVTSFGIVFVSILLLIFFKLKLEILSIFAAIGEWKLFDVTFG